MESFSHQISHPRLFTRNLWIFDQTFHFSISTCCNSTWLSQWQIVPSLRMPLVLTCFEMIYLKIRKPPKEVYGSCRMPFCRVTCGMRSGMLLHKNEISDAIFQCTLICFGHFFLIHNDSSNSVLLSFDMFCCVSPCFGQRCFPSQSQRQHAARLTSSATPSCQTLKAAFWEERKLGC